MFYKHLPLFVCVMMATLLTSCTANEDSTSDDGESGGIVVSITTQSALTTRTTLTDNNAVQHVEAVRLLVFDGSDDNALCVASEDTGWDSTQAADGQPTKSMTYHIQYDALQPSQTYSLVAIGLDDHSATTYTLPSIGTTLAEARATTSAQATRDDIAHSELFGGLLDLKTSPTAGYRGVLNLYRRVAGVMCQIDNLPQNILNTTGQSKEVGAIAIRLYTAQNKSVSLSHTDDITAHPLTTESDDVSLQPQTLIYIPRAEFATSTAGLTAKKGVYVLPIAAPTDASVTTLSLVVYDTDGQAIASYPIKMRKESQDNGVSTSTFTTQYSLDANVYYLLRAQLGIDTNIEIEPSFEKSHEFEVK